VIVPDTVGTGIINSVLRTACAVKIVKKIVSHLGFKSAGASEPIACMP
jgi:hypothetical protein